MAEMPVRDQVVVMAVHTNAEVVLAAVRTAARIWWAIRRDMAPKAASSLSSQRATSWAVTGEGSWTYSGSRDGAIHDPPEVLALQPELHLVDPNVVVGPIEDGDGSFNIGSGGGRHVGCWVSKRSPSARDLSMK